MRDIYQIIQKMSKEEKRHFTLFVNRNQKNKRGKQVEEVFKLVNAGKCKDDNALQKTLFANKSRNNFYQIKKRFVDELESSLFIQHCQDSIRQEILYYIGVARVYSNKLLFKEALDLLKKAERKAIKREYFDLLTVLYHECLSVAMDYDAIDFDEYMIKYSTTIQKYKAYIDIELVLKKVSYTLYKSNYAIQSIDIDKLLADIQEKLQLSKALINSPKVELSVHDAIKKLLLNQHKFIELEQFLISSLTNFEQKGIYTKANHSHKVVTLVWIINSHFKNRKFAASEQYIILLNKSLLDYNSMLQEKYAWTYQQCLVTQYFYTNRCEQAIGILEQLLEDKRQAGTPFYDILVYTNLVSMHYCQGNITKSMNYLGKLLVKDKFNKLPIPWQVSINVLELILHFENGDFIYLEYKIREILRAYKDIWTQVVYQSTYEFILLVKKLLQSPKLFKDELIKQLIGDYVLRYSKFEAASNEGINYQIWLQAKVQQIPYYTILLRTSSSNI